MGEQRQLRQTCEDEGYTKMYPNVTPLEEQEVTLGNIQVRRSVISTDASLTGWQFGISRTSQISFIHVFML